METSLYEQMGGNYTMQGNYALPDLCLPKEDSRSISVCGGSGAYAFSSSTTGFCIVTCLLPENCTPTLPIEKIARRNCFISW